MGTHLQRRGLAQWGAGQGALRALDPCPLPSPSSILWWGQGVCQPPGGLRRGGGERPRPSLTLTSGVGWDGGGLGSPPHPLPALGCRAPPQPSPCLPAAPQADLPPSAHGLSSRAAAPPILRLQAAPHHSDPQIPTLWHRQEAPASRSPCPSTSWAGVESRPAPGAHRVDPPRPGPGAGWGGLGWHQAPQKQIPTSFTTFSSFFFSTFFQKPSSAVRSWSPSKTIGSGSTRGHKAPLMEEAGAKPTAGAGGGSPRGGLRVSGGGCIGWGWGPSRDPSPGLSLVPGWEDGGPVCLPEPSTRG